MLLFSIFLFTFLAFNFSLNSSNGGSSFITSKPCFERGVSFIISFESHIRPRRRASLKQIQSTFLVLSKVFIISFSSSSLSNLFHLSMFLIILSSLEKYIIILFQRGGHVLSPLVFEFLYSINSFPFIYHQCNY